ncbi:MAG: MotA/TolQ/ExbB proton channel family protein [Pseudomonadota bacterium]
MPIDFSIERITQLVELGGPVVASLLLISVIALAIIVFKFCQFALLRVGKGERTLSILGNKTAVKNGSAMRDLQAIKGYGARFGAQALVFSRTEMQPNVSRDDIENELKLLAAMQFSKLNYGFRALDIIAQVSPLIGLFGTVLGMISAFQALQQSGNSVDPSVLAGGIWVALLTTAVGLAVAMPTSIALTYFESRVDRHRLSLERIMALALNPLASISHVQENAAERQLNVANHAT